MNQRSYFDEVALGQFRQDHQAALERCVDRVRAMLPIFGLRSPKLGRPGNVWDFCGPEDWTVGFFSGQLWLAYQLTGDPVFRNAARARRPAFRYILEHRAARDHDLGFQFSLHSVADWRLSGDGEARRMALAAADALIGRFRPEGGYIQAWNPRPGDSEHAAYVNGRMIADTIQNLALLYWAYSQTAIEDYREVADAHAETCRRHIIRPDMTSFHTFRFDAGSGKPVGGQMHQGYADGSCWSRGHAWLIHGYAQCFAWTRNPDHLETARALATKAEEMMGTDRIPVWDYRLPKGEVPYRDSSAAAIITAGLYTMAAVTVADEAERWRAFADRIIDGLLEECDLTFDPHAQGLLAHGAANVRRGRTDVMIPYGDYYFMEALMRSLGHRNFFW